LGFSTEKAERATLIASTIENNIIEAINENILGTNLDKECIEGFLPNDK